MSPSAQGATLTAWIEGVGIIGPGLADWPQTRQVLQGEIAYQATATELPSPAQLPAAERRRTSRVVKAALAVGEQACRMAGRDPAQLASVFASSGGDGDNCHVLCELLASGERQISPTRFHNSVHNAASGYWAIATGATPAAQMIGNYDATFAAGLMEALVQVDQSQAPLLLVVADSSFPAPLHAKRPVPDSSALALVLAPTRSEQAMARLALPRHGALGEASATALNGAAARLQAAVQELPPLAGLPVLAAALAAVARPVFLPFLPPQTLQVEVQGL